MRKNIGRIICTGLVCALLIGVSGCSGDSKDNENQTKASQEKTYNNVKATIKEILSKVKIAYGKDYIPDMEFDKAYMETTFGISEDMYEEAIGEGAAVSFHVDTFIGVKAKDGKADEVEKLLDKYREYLINDGMQYPENVIKLEYSKVTRFGNYVFFTCLGTADGDSDEEIAKKADEKNQIAVQAISEFFN